ncbi:MAG: pyridoxal phosphate-dependent aminotransferase [Eubacteriales bacterium]|nr:pyridoxal phosphate-dependent aminotransferase [Eubacteriales bacterium]
MISRYMKEKLSGGSVIRAMFEAGAKMRKERGDENVFDFSLGNPALELPSEITEAVKRLSDEPGIHAYMPNAGYADVRTAIATDYNRRFDTKLMAEDLVMTVGAAGALNVFLKTVINPGDEIIVPAPYFVEYGFYAENVGAILRVVPTDANFRPDMDALRAAVTSKTKVLITNSPNNPTGVVYTADELSAIAEILTDAPHTVYWISDEPYREIIYDDAVQASIFNYYRNSVVAYSYSKSLSLPGERIGYLAVHPDIDDGDDMRRALVTANRILGFVNAPALFQRLVGMYPGMTCDTTFYKRNRDLLLGVMDRCGFHYTRPEGAFYLFVDAPVPDEAAFCARAMDFGLLMVPSSAFGVPGRVRLAYCVAPDMIRRSEQAFWGLASAYGLAGRQ